MHIALVTHHYAPEVGAPQRRWGALVPRFVAEGHRVSVLTPPPHYPSGKVEHHDPRHAVGAVTTGEHGETIYRVRWREHGPGLVSRTVDQGVAAADAVARGMRHLSARSRRPDVVIATVPGIPSIGAGVALAHGLRIPLVVEMRDAWPDLIAPSGMLAGAGRRRGWRGVATTQAHRAMTFAQRDAAAIVTTTEAFAAVLRARSMRRVEVVRNGAYLHEIPHLGTRDQVGREVGSEVGTEVGTELRVLYLGTVGRSQGLSTAVRAAALAADEGVDVRLRIVGSGAETGALQALAWSLAAPVELPGPVPREEVLDHYRWADTLLVSLRAWGPFEWTVPSKLYEALATGRHVTGVLAGEAAGLVRSTGAGDVSPPEDERALADLWVGLARDRSQLAVGPTGREWAFRHANFEVLATHYLELLDEVVR